MIRRIAAQWGIGVVLVEHDIPLVLGVCDDVVVLDFGRCIATGTPDEIRRDPAVLAAYLGTDHQTAPAALPERHDAREGRHVTRTATRPAIGLPHGSSTIAGAPLISAAVSTPATPASPSSTTSPSM